MLPVSRLLSVSAAAVALLIMSGAAEARSRGANCDRGDQALGAIAGAVIGGVIGGQFGNGGNDRAIGAVAGALLGGATGASVADRGCDNDNYGSSYDPRYDAQATYDSAYGDRSDYADSRYDDVYAQDGNYYDDAFENADPYQSVGWQDPETGYRGTIEPQDWYQDDRGNDCRAFSQLIVIDGRREEATGTACRQSDGTWRIVE